MNVEYTYVDSLSDEAKVVNDYGKHEFEFYYYDQDDDNFNYYNGRRYRQLYVNEMKRSGSIYAANAIGDRVSYAAEVGTLYVQSWKNGLKQINALSALSGMV
ncbi:MAG: hypothetical protein EZS28_050369 [Streblomastix strix]|uniref:Uncharacterized protein n=1 Tax=Streblomastix strix TaxID=222440 RepID=A0A5J4T6V8_9EUKA|nr:MAG: hypothetical protein EZS28_050369 [Streblomastix strix]